LIAKVSTGLLKEGQTYLVSLTSGVVRDRRYP